jgi:hypothetical protein
VSDPDEDHREPRGTRKAWMRELGYCDECSGTLDRDGSCRWCGTDGVEDSDE